jgi:hypothetical protein
LHKKHQFFLRVLETQAETFLNRGESVFLGVTAVAARHFAARKMTPRRGNGGVAAAIRWDVRDEIGEEHRKRGVMAMYWQNAAQVMFPTGGCHEPPGPAAFVGEIIVNAECFPPQERSRR